MQEQYEFNTSVTFASGIASGTAKNIDMSLGVLPQSSNYIITVKNASTSADMTLSFYNLETIGTSGFSQICALVNGASVTTTVPVIMLVPAVTTRAALIGDGFMNGEAGRITVTNVTQTTESTGPCIVSVRIRKN